MYRKFLLALFAALLMVFALAGCYKSETTHITQQPPPPPPPPPVVETVDPPVVPTSDPPPPPPPVVQPSPCDTNPVADWTTGNKNGGNLHAGMDEITDVRFGRHDDECFDRVVVDVATTANVGYRVEYVDTVLNSAGHEVVVDGNAVLRITVDAWAKDFATGLNEAPVEVFTPAERDLFDGSWLSVQDIKFVETFEGQTVLAVGVDSKTPFTVFRLPGTDANGQPINRVVIDIKN